MPPRILPSWSAPKIALAGRKFFPKIPFEKHSNPLTSGDRASARRSGPGCGHREVHISNNAIPPRLWSRNPELYWHPPSKAHPGQGRLRLIFFELKFSTFEGANSKKIPGGTKPPKIGGMTPSVGSANGGDFAVDAGVCSNVPAGALEYIPASAPASRAHGGPASSSEYRREFRDG